ncbi:MAG: transposase, partial [Bradymonadia bacterium]
MKTPWCDGTIALQFTPERFVARLASLIPRPVKNLVRYHGVLAPNARGRSEIVPVSLAVADYGGGSRTRVSPPRCGRSLVWAELLRRVFEIDLLKYPTCAGRLRLMSVILDGLSARRSLQGAGRRPEPAARPPPPQRDGPAAVAWTWRQGGHRGRGEPGTSAGVGEVRRPCASGDRIAVVHRLRSNVDVGAKYRCPVFSKVEMSG